MSNIVPREGKNGVAYRFTVCLGKDSEGKQIRRTKTWHPEPNMTRRQADKAAEKEYYDFERRIRYGFAPDARITFEEYAETVLTRMEAEGKKHKSVLSYRNLLKRINPAIGFMRLTEIRPAHLNEFYNMLAKTQTSGSDFATPIPTFKDELKRLGYTQKALAEASGLSKTTIEKLYAGNRVATDTAKKLCSSLGIPPEKLFCIHTESRTLSYSTILRYHQCIRAILGRAEKEMLVEYNAAERASPPSPHRTEAESYTPEEVQAIVAALESEPIKWAAIVHMLAATGGRRGEVLGLMWTDLDFSTGSLTISRALLYSPDRGLYVDDTKTRNIRHLYIGAETLNVLTEYRNWQDETKRKMGDQRQQTGYIFTREDGRPVHPDSLNTWLDKFAARHNLPHINPHKFRHTAASILIRNNVDPRTAATHLGHTRTSTTLDIYSHIYDKDSAEAAASRTIASVVYATPSDDDLPF